MLHHKIKGKIVPSASLRAEIMPKQCKFNDQRSLTSYSLFFSSPEHRPVCVFMVRN